MIYCVGTMETKGEEVLYLANTLAQLGSNVKTVNLSANPSTRGDVNIFSEKLATNGFHQNNGRKKSDISFPKLTQDLSDFLLKEVREGRASGVIGIGGSSGTAIIAPALQQLPLGFPKVLISTVASGNVSPYIGTSDICLMNSVSDIAGLNGITKTVLSNGAAAVFGMSQNYKPLQLSENTVALTMFGVTTPCVEGIRKKLSEKNLESVVFHATGVGGRAMEKLVDKGDFFCVLDITTTEIADEVVGGVMACGPHRFDVMLKKKTPWILSLGGLDMVNFGSIESVPPRFLDRNLYEHNPFVTLMRTSVEENRKFARWIADKLNGSEGRFCILIPEKGLSELDKKGKVFYDPEADAALFAELESVLSPRNRNKLFRLPYHINDPEFGLAAVEALENLLQDEGEFSSSNILEHRS